MPRVTPMAGLSGPLVAMRLSQVPTAAPPAAAPRPMRRMTGTQARLAQAAQSTTATGMVMAMTTSGGARIGSGDQIENTSRSVTTQPPRATTGARPLERALPWVDPGARDPRASVDDVWERAEEILAEGLGHRE